MFVLTDNNFAWIKRFSSDTKELGQFRDYFVNFPKGFIEGALDVLGIKGDVTVEVKLPKGCMYFITFL